MSNKTSFNNTIEIKSPPENIKIIDIINTELFDVLCRLEQVKGVISVWIDANSGDNINCVMLAAIMTLLDGMNEAIEEVENKLMAYEHTTQTI